MLLISDVHFGINQQSEVDRILEAARPERSGGCVVCAGDLVQSATTSEFEAAGEFVRALINLGNTVCMTPGNHDFQISGAPDGWGSDKTNFLPVKRDKARRLYREHILAPLLEQDGVVAHGDDSEEAIRYDLLVRHGRDLFLCLRSTHRRSVKATFLGFRSIGRIRKKQVAWAREALEEGLDGWEGEPPRIHIVSHRSMWQTKGDKHPPLSKRKRVEELIRDFDIFSYIHGHNHLTRFEKVPTRYLELPIVRLALPSVCDRVDETERAFMMWDPETPNVVHSETMAGSTRLDLITSETPMEIAREPIEAAAENGDWADALERISKLEAPLDNDLVLVKIRALIACGDEEEASKEAERHLAELHDEELESAGFERELEQILR